ncbi:MAG: AEC family transporter [Chloroflexi bacterium]|nr:AEC family transporter [Chloroflexota bacterium]
MAELLSIMLNVISPIFIIVGIVVLIARRLNPDPRGLSTILVYLFIPSLAFTGIVQSDLRGGEVIGLAAVAVGMSLLMALVGLGVSRLAKFDRKLESAFLISIILVNAANYGIPLNRFAFGPDGERQAIIYYVMSVMMGNVLGVYFASRGEASVKAAVLNVLKVPIAYAALAGLIVNLAEITLPLPVERAVGILSQASVPGMLALLGLKLAEASLSVRWRPLLLATGIRLVLAPLIAFPMAALLGLTGTTFQVAIVESSMPTAVLANALATQFNSDAEFTSAVTLVSTLASIVTLSILIAILTG